MGLRAAGIPTTCLPAAEVFLPSSDVFAPAGGASSGFCLFWPFIDQTDSVK